jgi:glycosyltransferase involved in cell wall biosynthesis
VSAAPSQAARRFAFLVRDLGSGGSQRSQMRLAGAAAARGLNVDLVVCSARLIGTGVAPAGVRVVNLRPGSGPLARFMPLLADPAGFVPIAAAMLTRLRPSPTLRFLPALVRYLRRERPQGVVAAATTLNLEAIWARRLAQSSARLVVCERGHLPPATTKTPGWRQGHLTPLVTRYYPLAEAIVASSASMADELAAAAGMDRQRVVVIHNTLAGPEIAARAAEPCPHPWLDAGSPPVILSGGRLAEQKDFPTLVRAFALLRAQRRARLLILARDDRSAKRSAQLRREITELATSLGVAADMAILDGQPNPYAFMSRAGVFVLSSAWEGFGDVLVEAMACGCPVVSTDCPHGPREILEEGRLGPLVRVGDAVGMAAAIARTLDAPPARTELVRRAAAFSLDRAVDGYLRLLTAV